MSLTKQFATVLTRLATADSGDRKAEVTQRAQKALEFVTLLRTRAFAVEDDDDCMAQTLSRRLTAPCFDSELMGLMGVRLVVAELNAGSVKALREFVRRLSTQCTNYKNRYLTNGEEFKRALRACRQVVSKGAGLRSLLQDGKTLATRLPSLGSLLSGSEQEFASGFRKLFDSLPADFRDKIQTKFGIDADVLMAESKRIADEVTTPRVWQKVVVPVIRSAKALREIFMRGPLRKVVLDCLKDGSKMPIFRDLATALAPPVFRDAPPPTSPQPQ